MLHLRGVSCSISGHRINLPRVRLDVYPHVVPARRFFNNWLRLQLEVRQKLLAASCVTGGKQEVLSTVYAIVRIRNLYEV